MLQQDQHKVGQFCSLFCVCGRHPDGDLVVPNGYQPETLQLVLVGPGSDGMDVKLFHVSGGLCKCMQSDCCGLQSYGRERPGS